MSESRNNFRILWNDKVERAYYVTDSGFAIPVIGGVMVESAGLQIDFALVKRIERIDP